MIGNIYLVGFMGSGKTTVGRLLAQTLNRQFVDMDEELEKKFRKPISEVFAQRGEETFRITETALLKDLSRRERLVVAAGGGAADRDENRAYMSESGRVVHLQTDLVACMHRLNESDRVLRPLWRDMEFVERLFDRRKSVYAQADLAVAIDGKSPAAVTQAVVNALFPDREITAALGDTSCPVRCTWQAQDTLKESAAGRRVAILTDKNVERLHVGRFREVLQDAVVFTIQPGDRTKTLHTAQRVYEGLLEHRFDRGDLLVAIGGGVVTDLGAFVAATFKRGMGFVLVSTSLLGCVDAAVGGKAAVNMGQAKNVVGCFTIPELVVLDLSALITLRRNHRSEGLVEAYKTGLVACPELAELVDGHAGELLAGDLPLLGQVVSLSAGTKADVVSRDFRESGLRRILNFGHTFGHAVEGYHRYKVSHGDSVALGMIVATLVSEARGLISRETRESIVRTIRRISPRQVACPPLAEAWEIMLQDKKIRRGRMVFVLLQGIGTPVCVEDVSQDELSAALSRLAD
jgi:shikimate kinase / 3-dehydroquinate synthase